MLQACHACRLLDACTAAALQHQPALCAQVHIFSRHCENKTDMFPDVVSAILRASRHPAAPQEATASATHPDASAAAADPAISTSTDADAFQPARSFIVDSELVAVDRAANNRLRAFQELSTRARGGTAGGAGDAVRESDVTVHVCVFLFDLLHIDGEDLLALPFRERRARLAAAFPALKAGHVALAQGVELRVVPDEAAAGASSALVGTAQPARAEGLEVDGAQAAAEQGGVELATAAPVALGLAEDALAPAAQAQCQTLPVRKHGHSSLLSTQDPNEPDWHVSHQIRLSIALRRELRHE